MTEIYIVEDDANIREIETYALQNSGYHVEGFENGRTFFAGMEKSKPKLVLLDIMLPDMDGMEILSRIRRTPEYSYIPVIMVTAKTTEIDKVKGLDGGADDYITKPFGVMELISRVKALLRRTSDYEENRPITIGTITMDPEKRKVMVEDKNIELTFKEFELLKLFMQNPEMVLNRDLIMERVWGFDFAGESRTLDMHIKTLRQKLGSEGSRITTVRNVGYRMDKT